MDRTKTLTRNAICCLITSIILWAPKVLSAEHDLGIISEMQGEITYLDVLKVNTLTTVKQNDPLQANGSYLTRSDAYFNVDLFDGSSLRLNPKSKISIEYNPESRTVMILILTGSIKISIDPDRKDQKLAQIMVQSAGATFETAGADFTVTRNLLTDQSSVYVEKGTVTATQYVQNQKKDRELVHASEKTTIHDRVNEVESPIKMTEKEIYFLNPKNYPNNSQTSF